MLEKKDFVHTMVEGLSIVPAETALPYAIGLLHESRADLLVLKQRLKALNEISSEVKVKCVVCGEHYDLYCELSEFDPEYSYCGRSPRCCP